MSNSLNNWRSFVSQGFDDETRLFIQKIKRRTEKTPPQLHKDLKSYEHRQGIFYVADSTIIKNVALISAREVITKLWNEP